MFNKVTIKGAKQAVQMFGPAQAAVARAVVDSVEAGVIPKNKVDDYCLMVGVFIHWDAADDQKIFDYNYQATKESIQRAFGYLHAKKVEMGVARELDTSDFHVEAIDLLGNRVAAEIGIAFTVAAYSALRTSPTQPGLLVLGDMSIQGNIKPVRSLVEPLPAPR